MRGRWVTGAVLCFALAGWGCGTSTLRCGPGTAAKNGACVLSAGGCGHGTTETKDGCGPSPALSCGPGTHEDHGVCLGDSPHDPVLSATPWSPNVRIGSPDIAAFRPSLAVDSQQRIYVAFDTSNGVELWRSEDGSTFEKVFSDPADNSLGFTFAFHLSVAVSGADKVIIAWARATGDATSSGIWSAFSDNGTIYYPHLVQATRGGGAIPAPTLSTAPDGRVFAGWSDGSGLYAAVTDTFGQLSAGAMTWAFTQKIPARLPAMLGALAFGSDGQPIAAVDLPQRESAPGASLDSLVAVEPSRGIDPIFEAPLAVTRAYAFAPQAAVATDASGRTRILFVDARSERSSIFEARSSDGAPFTQPARLFDDPARPSADTPALAVDALGGLHALFFDTRTGGWLTYAAHAPPGGDFGAPERVGEAEGLESAAGSPTERAAAIAVRGGRLFAVWSDPRQGVYLSTRDAP